MTTRAPTASNETDITFLVEPSNDGDKIECEAVSDASKAANAIIKTSITLHVAYGPVADPLIQLYPPVAKEGDALKLDCYANYFVNPYPPIVEWFIEGRKIDGDMTIGRTKYYLSHPQGMRKSQWNEHPRGIYSELLIINELNAQEHQGITVECRVKNQYSQIQRNKSVVLNFRNRDGVV